MKNILRFNFKSWYMIQETTFLFIAYVKNLTKVYGKESKGNILNLRLNISKKVVNIQIQTNLFICFPPPTLFS